MARCKIYIDGRCVADGEVEFSEDGEVSAWDPDPVDVECSGEVILPLSEAMTIWPEAFVNAPGGRA